MRISDWSSDVCSSDLRSVDWDAVIRHIIWDNLSTLSTCLTEIFELRCGEAVTFDAHSRIKAEFLWDPWKFTTQEAMIDDADKAVELVRRRSEEHTSELQSLMRISYAVFCLKNTNLPSITKFNQLQTHKHTFTQTTMM